MSCSASGMASWASVHVRIHREAVRPVRPGNRLANSFIQIEVYGVTLITYLLAGLIVLVRVCVPVSLTFMGGWPVRLLLFFLWLLAIAVVGGSSLGQFFSKLKARWAEVACYSIWVAILGFFWMTQGGEHVLTSFLLNAYIGTIPFYVLGTYYSVDAGKGRGMALATGMVVGASCLIAIPVVWQDPSLVRMGSITLTAETRSLGIGSYADLTGFAIVLPFFIVASLQSKHLARLVGIASCLATVAFLLIATFAGVILLTGMAVAGSAVYYLLLGGLRWRRILLTSTAAVAMGLAAIYLFPSVYERADIGQFYDKLANTFSSLSDIFSGETKDPTQRYSLMLDSLQVFLDNPVMGVGMESRGIGTAGTGGHSSWIDALANYGLFGGVPYLMFHLLVLRRLWQAWRGDRQNAMYWGCLLSCAVYMFYGIFNVTTQGTTVALFLYVTAAGGQRSKVTANRQAPVFAHPKVNR